MGKTYYMRELLQLLPCRSFGFHAKSSLATLAQSLSQPSMLVLWEPNKSLAQGARLEIHSFVDFLAVLSPLYCIFKIFTRQMGNDLILFKS